MDIIMIPGSKDSAIHAGMKKHGFMIVEALLCGAIRGIIETKSLLRKGTKL